MILLLTIGAVLWSGKWISDDGYIYLGYVRMFEIHGEFVFNTGERVDAATGFLWLLLLTAADILTPFWNTEQACLALSLALAITACASVMLDRLGLVSIVTAAALFAPDFMRSFATSGLETPLILLVLVALHITEKPLTRAIICGALPFVRPELFLVSSIYMAPAVVRLRLSPLATCLAVALGLAATRYAIFGDVLPNTSFAKLGMEHFGSGRAFAGEFVLSYPEMLGVQLLLLAWSIKFAVRDPSVLTERGFLRLCAPLLASILLIAMVIKAGGGFMHGRFFVPAFVLLALATSEWARFALQAASVSQRNLLTSLLILWPLTGTMGMSYALRHIDEPHPFRYISEERTVYGSYNENQGRWGEENLSPWAEEARLLAALAETTGSEVGIFVEAIGHRRYFSAGEPVYIYDSLSLAQVTGTLLDISGRPDRPGHMAGLPRHFVYRNPRVSLFPLPDSELNDLLTFNYQNISATLGSLEQIPRYVSAGLLPAETANLVERRVGEIIDADQVDTETLLFLWHRYQGLPETRSRIAGLFDAVRTVPYSFPWWEDQTRTLHDRAEAITRGDIASLPGRYEMMLEAESLKPLKRRFSYRRFVDPNAETCEVPVSEWTIEGSVPHHDPTDTQLLTLHGPSESVLALHGSAIAENCSISPSEVQLLLEPVSINGQAVPTLLVGKERRPIPLFSAKRHDYQPEVRFRMAAPNTEYVVTLPIPESTRVTLKITAIAF
ncbi:hypothetical protein ACW9UR_21880 [Halovulum sp. GXIMD14794]